MSETDDLIAFVRAVKGQVTNRITLQLANQLDRLSKDTRRMLSALDHYWAAYEIDERRMSLWWGAFERERAKVEEKQ